MQAFCLTATQQIVKIERELPKVQPGEILLKVTRCGVCRTDRKAYYQGQRDLHMPRVLGHEITGRIQTVGQGVQGYQAGQRVAVHPGIFCGECEDCLAGRDQLCNQMQILGFHLDGGFQEYCLIPASGVRQKILLPLPENLSFKQAALMEPLACAINMQNSLQTFSGDRLLIIGAGALGILTAFLWQAKGCSDIAFLEIEAAKRNLAQQSGYPAYACPEELKTTPTVVIPCCPDNVSFYQAINLAAKGSRIGFFSGLTSRQSLDPKIINELHYKELKLAGSYGCSIEHSRQALQLLPQIDLPIYELKPEDLIADLQNLEHKENLISALIWEAEN